MQNTANMANNNDQYYAAKYAIENKDLDKLFSFINSGLQLNYHPYDAPPLLSIACGLEYLDGVKLLLYYNNDITWEPDSGNLNNLPIHIAADSGNINILNLLLQYGSPCHIYNNDFNTPLHLAIIRDDLQICEALLQKIPESINWLDSTNRNLLHLAVKNSSINMVVNLLEKSPTFAITKDANNRYPLDYATDEKIKKVLQADMQYHLKRVIQVNHMPIVQTFIHNYEHLNLNLRDAAYKKPIHYASTSSMMENLLLTNGAIEETVINIYTEIVQNTKGDVALCKSFAQELIKQYNNQIIVNVCILSLIEDYKERLAIMHMFDDAPSNLKYYMPFRCINPNKIPKCDIAFIFPIPWVSSMEKYEIIKNTTNSQTWDMVYAGSHLNPDPKCLSQKNYVNLMKLIPVGNVMTLGLHPNIGVDTEASHEPNKPIGILFNQENIDQTNAIDLLQESNIYHKLIAEESTLENTAIYFSYTNSIANMDRSIFTLTDFLKLCIKLHERCLEKRLVIVMNIYPYDKRDPQNKKFDQDKYFTTICRYLDPKEVKISFDYKNNSNEWEKITWGEGTHQVNILNPYPVSHKCMLSLTTLSEPINLLTGNSSVFEGFAAKHLVVYQLTAWSTKFAQALEDEIKIFFSNNHDSKYPRLLDLLKEKDSLAEEYINKISEFLLGNSDCLQRDAEAFSQYLISTYSSEKLISQVGRIFKLNDIPEFVNRDNASQFNYVQNMLNFIDHPGYELVGDKCTFIVNHFYKAVDYFKRNIEQWRDIDVLLKTALQIELDTFFSYKVFQALNENSLYGEIKTMCDLHKEYNEKCDDNAYLWSQFPSYTLDSVQSEMCYVEEFDVDEHSTRIIYNSLGIPTTYILTPQIINCVRWENIPADFITKIAQDFNFIQILAVHLSTLITSDTLSVKKFVFYLRLPEEIKTVVLALLNCTNDGWKKLYLELCKKEGIMSIIAADIPEDVTQYILDANIFPNPVKQFAEELNFSSSFKNCVKLISTITDEIPKIYKDKHLTIDNLRNSDAYNVFQDICNNYFTKFKYIPTNGRFVFIKHTMRRCATICKLIEDYFSYDMHNVEAEHIKIIDDIYIMINKYINIQINNISHSCLKDVVENNRNSNENLFNFFKYLDAHANEGVFDDKIAIPKYKTASHDDLARLCSVYFLRETLNMIKSKFFVYMFNSENNIYLTLDAVLYNMKCNANVSIDYHNESLYTLAKYLIENNDLNSIKSLIVKKLALNPGSLNEPNLLAVAFGKGDLICAKLLMEGGAHINHYNGGSNIYNIPIYAAIKSGQNHALDFILSHFPDNITIVYTATKKNFLHTALYNGQGLISEYLLYNVYTKDKNLIDEHGNSPLHVIAKSGNCPWMLNKWINNADYRRPNNDGYVPIELAIIYDNDTILRYMPEYSLNNEDIEQAKYLAHLAAQHNSLSCMKYLFSFYYDTITDSDETYDLKILNKDGGISLLNTAIDNNSADIIIFLQKDKFNLNIAVEVEQVQSTTNTIESRRDQNKFK